MGVSKRKSSPVGVGLTKPPRRGRKRGQGGRSEAEGTGPVLDNASDKFVVLTHDETNVLTIRAFNLSEQAHVLALAVKALEKECDKLRTMCEAINDRLVVAVAGPGRAERIPKDSLGPTGGLPEVDDGWWQTLEKEALQGTDEVPPVAKRQLSFYDGAT